MKRVIGAFNIGRSAVVEEGANVPADMLEVIEACYQRCEALVNSFASKLDAQPVPATVYHYTDSAGLLGILKSGKIWLTDIFGLSDLSANDRSSPIRGRSSPVPSNGWRCPYGPYGSDHAMSR